MKTNQPKPFRTSMFRVRCWLLNVAVLATVGSALADVHYVDVNGTNATPPYTNWTTAATNIQDAVDAAVAGDEVVVTNGVYQTGAKDVYGMSNRVAVTKPMAVRSVNGAAVTTIVGFGPSGPEAVRCAYLTNGAVLAGFTLTNGATQDSGDFFKNLSGAGVWCESPSAVVSNCVLTGNRATFFSGPGSEGGGAYSGTLVRCILTNNEAVYGGGTAFSTLNYCMLSDNGAGLQGGGANGGTLNNCTLVGNSARNGGGAAFCTLNNCTVINNSGSFGGGAAYGTMNNCIACFNYSGGNTYSVVLNYSWTTDPLFVDYAGGDLRLQSNSPCINAGKNSYVRNTTDLDGNPRIAGGTVDIGAYEFQSPVSRISYAWLQQYGLPINANTDASDPDGDGLNNWQEWRCLTDPTNALSVLKMLAPSNAVSGVSVSWQSVVGVNYFLERSANLAAPPTFTSLATNILGQPGTSSYTDTNALGAGPWFYRVGVQ